MPQSRENILVIDDEPGMCRLLQAVLMEAGYKVSAHQAPQEALKTFERERFDLVISDVQMPKLSGIDVLQSVRSRAPDLPVILITAFGSTRTVVEAMKLGTTDFITKPFKNHEIRLVVEGVLERRGLAAENARLRQELAAHGGFGGMVGSTPAMRDAFRVLAEAAESDLPLLIEGATGTGKELAARTVHLGSQRAGKAFVSLDFAAADPADAETRLLAALSGGGTLYLKNVDSMSAAAQSTLLRSIQEGRVRRQGGIESDPLTARLVAGSRESLAEASARGRFRADLYRRLSSFKVVLPPLSERRADVPALAAHFLERASRRLSRRFEPLEPEIIDALGERRWAGNVAELAAAIERAAALARGDRLGSESFESAGSLGSPLELRPFREAKQSVVDRFEKAYLLRVLKASEGNITRAAAIADMDRKNLYELLKKHQLTTRQDGEDVGP